MVVAAVAWFCGQVKPHEIHRSSDGSLLLLLDPPFETEASLDTAERSDQEELSAIIQQKGLVLSQPASLTSSTTP